MAHIPELERPLTPRQVATLFNVTLETVTAWADDGKIPCFRTPGGHRRFRPGDVKRLLASPDAPPEQATA